MGEGKGVLRSVVTAVLVPAALVTAWASHTIDVVPLDPHGDAVHRNLGAVPLDPTTVVAAAQGEDGVSGTADDRVLLVTVKPGATPIVAHSVVGALSRNGARWTRLSASRAVVTGTGEDAAPGGGDDELILVDRVGSGNDVSSLFIGNLSAGTSGGGFGVPVRLTPDLVAMSSSGEDGVVTTADDVVALVSVVGTGRGVVGTPGIPNLARGGRSRPVRLSPSSVLVSATGADAEVSTDDDLVYLIDRISPDAIPTKTPVPVPYLHEYRPGRAVRVTSTLAVVASYGPDEEAESADDRVYVLSDLGGTNTVAWIGIPGLPYTGGQACVLGPDRIAVAAFGADLTSGTADDSVAVISNLGTTNDVTYAVVGPLENGGQYAPVRLSPSSFVTSTSGPDGVQNTPDDRLAIVTAAGGANSVSYVTVPGVGTGLATQAVSLSTSAVLLNSGGPDADFHAGLDDVLTVVTGIGSVPSVESVALDPRGGSAADENGVASRPALAGNGVAVFLGGGPDGFGAQGGDDVVLVATGLPQGRTISVKKLRLRFRQNKPQKGEKLLLKADLVLDDTSLFGMDDVTISIGNAAESVPADVVVERRGKRIYKRPKGGTGWIKKLVYNPAKGTLLVRGKGQGTGAETTSVHHVPVTVDANEWFFVGESLSGKSNRSGIRYRRIE